jgi:ABC-type antimicrobial peptide transport system permease subunit
MAHLSGYPGVSAMQYLAGAGLMIVSIDNFKRLIEPNATDFSGQTPSDGTSMTSEGVFDVRFQKLFIKVNPSISSDQRKFFVNSIQVALDPYYSTTVDTQSVVASVREVSTLTLGFFYFCAAIACILASFMMWLVFVSNVTQNAWAFGVLRSLGFTKVHLLRSTIFEALCIALSAFSLGLPVGVLVGYTASLQFNTFLNLPFDFIVPYPILLVLLGVSVLAATVGSYVPLSQLNKLPVAVVLKKYN